MASDLTVKKDLTELQNSFLAHLFDPEISGDIRKAMNAAGYSSNTSIKEVTEPLKEHIIDAAQSHLALNAVTAAIGLTDTIISPNTLGAGNKIKAAESVLDRIGITKKDSDGMKVPQGAIVFLPPKEKVEITISTNQEPPIKTING